MGTTATEKIVARHAVGLRPGQTVRAGDYVTIRPKHLMTHDNTGAVIPKFKSIGATKVFDPKQPVFAIDHDIQNKTPENLGKYAKIEAFAHEHGIDYYPPGRGIAHQVMIEEGYVTPGSLCVGSDSHSNIYGAIGACGTPVVRTDAAAIWATGETWWQIPDQVQVVLEGQLPAGATGKDVIITLCGHFKNDEVLNCCLEFTGPGVAKLSIEERMTISNMTTEWGALTGMFPFDDVLKQFLLERARYFAKRGKRIPYTDADVERWWNERDTFAADADAHYAKIVTLDLSTVSPHVSGPNSVKEMAPAAALEREKIKVNRAYLMSCVNARLSDFEAAAKVFSGNGSARKVASGVAFYVAAASSDVESQARSLGYWQTLMDAGAIALPPGCGACIGLGQGTLEEGEVGISATNRNFEGRMGDRTALCYLASPVVVAESACRGYIAAPSGSATDVRGDCKVLPAPKRDAGAQDIIDGFPERITGRALYLPLDNLNTDGIYGKDVTYRDDITREQQGQYAMLNYDPNFQSIAQAGDIIVGGSNFGTGSSREQAATALASRGIRLVIAATSGQTYKRNAFNNGFIVLECPALTDQLAEMFADQARSGTRTIPGPTIDIDFAKSTVTCNGKTHTFGTLSETAQRLVVAGGSEAVVQGQLAAS
ncbi:MAG: homoaconitase [Phycisphaerales bacterium]|nr:homoaconitase [Phycisphaerales bacterium]